jgi:hypothetical protein
VGWLELFSSPLVVTFYLPTLENGLLLAGRAPAQRVDLMP